MDETKAWVLVVFLIVVAIGSLIGGALYSGHMEAMALMRSGGTVVCESDAFGKLVQYK